jgi:hypothetical protein
MSFLKSAMIAGALSATFATVAFAGENNPWDMRDRTAYAVMMDGTMKSMDISDKGMAMLMRRAKKVPRGTVFFMNNGQLYMASAASMFDRASGGALFSR